MGDRTVNITGTREDGKTTTVTVQFKKGKHKHRLKKISFFKLASIDLSPLASHSKLENIHLSCSSLQSIDLTPLTKCKRLQSVFLKAKELTTIDLTPLQNHNLSYLAIQCPDLLSLDLTPLSNSTNLQYVFIKADHMQSLNLTPLASSKKLNDLSIACAQLSSLDLSPLKKHNLVHLGIKSENLESVDLQPISNSTNLTSLEILASKLQTLVRDSLPTEKLEKFRLNNTAYGQFNTSFLAKAEKLVEVDFAYNSIYSIDLSVFAEKQKLQKIDLSYNKLRILDISPLFTCSTLNAVNLVENDDVMTFGFISLPGQYNTFQSYKRAGISSKLTEDFLVKHNNIHRSILQLCDILIVLFPSRNVAEVLLLMDNSHTIEIKPSPCSHCNSTSPRYGAVFSVGGNVWACSDCLRRNYLAVIADHKVSFQLDLQKTKRLTS